MDTRFIWGGDWNCILDKSSDTMDGSPSLKKESVKLTQNLMNDYNLVNVWRFLNPKFEKKFMETHKTSYNEKARLFLVSDKMQLDISACDFYAPVQSDHSPILRFSHFRRLLEGKATGSLITPLSMNPLLLKRQRKSLMRFQWISLVSSRITLEISEIRFDNSQKFTRNKKHVNVGRNR